MNFNELGKDPPHLYPTYKMLQGSNILRDYNMPSYTHADIHSVKTQDHKDHLFVLW